MLKRASILVVLAIAAPAYAERIVAVAPLSTLGAEDKSAATKKLSAEIEQAIAALAGTKVIPAAKVSEAIDKAKKPQLKACEGDANCLAELGKLVGANVVVSGEVGGLGDSKVIYLGAIDVATAKEMRSTTLTIGAKSNAADASGAAIRLLDPDKYRGTVHFTIDVGGASVFVNGTKVALDGHGDLALPVGTQAVRITHPQYHDFIKFLDVPYGKLDVPVAMTQYPIVEHDIHAKPTSRDKVIFDDPPLWRRWYIAGPIIAAVAIGVGISVGYAVHDVPAFQDCRMLAGQKC